MTISIWIVLAIVSAIMLWFYNKKRKQSTHVIDLQINTKKKKYEFSDTEKMISGLKSIDTPDKFSTHENRLQSETNTEPDEIKPIQNNNTITIGSFILEKKKKK